MCRDLSAVEEAHSHNAIMNRGESETQILVANQLNKFNLFLLL